MIDLSKIRYRVVVMDGSGKQYHIQDFIQNLGWEENKNEISARISFTSRNDKTSIGYLSDVITPGCLVGIFASDGGSFNGEVIRGYVETWNISQQNSSNQLKCTCYDDLYKLQKSQDNIYFPDGTGTQSAITNIFNNWGIPLAAYQGPDVAHSKQKFNNRYLSDMILELLDDAEKKGGEKCVVKTEQGFVKVVPRGSNKDVYVFRVDNTQSFSQSISMADLVTRVKVVGQADDNGNSSVEATLNGLTQYGVRQRIYTRGTDEDLAAAQSAAQEILDEEGDVEKTMTVQSPDVPFVHKGDLVYIMSDSVSNYYYVQSVQHNADNYSMTMELEYAEPKIEDGSSQKKKEYNTGDIVNFHGGTHYISSYPDAKGYRAKAGRARITKKNGSGKAHPWHLIHEDKSSNVYGWVDNGTFD